MRPFPSTAAIKGMLPSEHKPFSLIWSSFAEPLSANGPRNYLVLDSSFNPPHRAHSGLIQASYPPDAKENNVLLVLSTKNVEKAEQEQRTATQRLEMMHAFALNLLQEASSPLKVSIGCLAEPTFVGKSTILLSHLPQGSTLSFILGWDTVIRLFDPRFYPANTMHDKLQHFFSTEHSSILWARRPTESSSNVEEEEKAFFGQEEVQRYMSTKQIVRIEKELQDVSSTAVRKAKASRDAATLDELLCPQVKQYIQEQGLYE